MKKSLFALAATTAFAGAAQAQSSVTVYGIMDMGYVGSSYRQVTAQGLSSPVGGSQGGVTKTTSNALSAGAQSTNRIGFRGNEDLGGGSSAFFTVEFGLSPQDANATGSSSAGLDINGVQNQAGSAVDNRQSFVGLKKNGVGSFAFGRQYTPVFNYAAATNTGAFNNVAGDVIYVSGSTGTYANGFNNNQGFTNRMSNAVTASSDSFAGFKVDAMYSLNAKDSSINPGANTSSTTGGNVNLTAWGLGANYTWKKLLVNAAYQNVNTKIDNPVLATATLINLNGGSSLGGQLTSAGTEYNSASLRDKQFYAGATYDFGILKAYANYINRAVSGSGVSAAGSSSLNTSNTIMNRTAQQIGVRSYITPTVESWASVGNGRYQGTYGTYTLGGLPAGAISTYTNSASPWVSFVGYQLGSNYYLSKRTNLYGIAGVVKSTSKTTNVAGSGNSAVQYAVGVRHTF